MKSIYLILQKLKKPLHLVYHWKVYLHCRFSKVWQLLLKVVVGRPILIYNKAPSFFQRTLFKSQSGHAGEFHPHVPTEPYVKVSLHTALHVKITRN